MTPLVSIIVPAFNAASWIARTIQSALAQTWPQIEIIIIDDGSTDETFAIAKSFDSPRLRAVSQSNQGAAAARNHGISLAHGDYLQFLDADDLLAPDKIESQLARLLQAKPTAIATCAWARFREDPSAAQFIPEQLWHDLYPIDWLVCSWQHHTMMATAAWLVPRALAERAGPWNTSFKQNPVDDMEYFSRVLLAADQVLFCGEAKVFYRSELPGSLSRRRSDDAWRAIFNSFQVTADRLLDKEDSPRTRSAVATALQQLVFEAYPRVPTERGIATRRIQKLGGSELKPDAGPMRRRLNALIGWRATKRLHDWFYHSSR